MKKKASLYYFSTKYILDDILKFIDDCTYIGSIFTKKEIHSLRYELNEDYVFDIIMSHTKLNFKFAKNIKRLDIIYPNCIASTNNKYAKLLLKTFDHMQYVFVVDSIEWRTPKHIHIMIECATIDNVSEIIKGVSEFKYGKSH